MMSKWKHKPTGQVLDLEGLHIDYYNSNIWEEVKND